MWGARVRWRDRDERIRGRLSTRARPARGRSTPVREVRSRHVSLQAPLAVRASLSEVRRKGRRLPLFGLESLTSDGCGRWRTAISARVDDRPRRARRPLSYYGTESRPILNPITMTTTPINAIAAPTMVMRMFPELNRSVP